MRIKTKYDVNSGGISVLPQNLGRELRNLFWPAFYATNELSQQQQNGSVSTVTVRPEE